MTLGSKKLDDYEIEETLLSSIRNNRHHLLLKTRWNTEPEERSVYHVLVFTIASDGSRENFDEAKFGDVRTAVKFYKRKLELVL